jgi:hypothetical protein
MGEIRLRKTNAMNVRTPRLILPLLACAISANDYAFAKDLVVTDENPSYSLRSDLGSRYNSRFLCVLVGHDSGALLHSTQEVLPIECAIECNYAARRVNQTDSICFFEGKSQSDFLIPKRLPGQIAPVQPVRLNPVPSLAFNVVVYGKEVVSFNLETSGGDRNQLDFECKFLTKFIEEPEMTVNRFAGTVSLILIENTHNGLIEIQCSVRDSWSSDSIVIRGRAIAD